METNQVQVLPLCGRICYIRIQKTKRTVTYRDDEGNKKTKPVDSKTWIVYVKTGDEYTNSEAVPMFKFEGSPNDDEFISQFKGLHQDDDPETGEKIIRAETILNAPCPEDKKKNLVKGTDDVERYKGPDGTLYDKYGEYLVELGTRNAEDPDLWQKGTRAIVKANLPIADGVCDFMRMDKDGKPVKRANGQVIQIKTTDVAAVVGYNKVKNDFVGDGGCTPYQQLRSDINRQIERGRLKLVSINTATPKKDEEDEEVRDAGQD